MVHAVRSMFVFALLAAETAHAQETFELVSATPGGHFANADSIHPRVSGDGRFVAFESRASDLVPGDTNGAIDVYVRDLRLGVTRRVSVSHTGAQITFGSNAGLIVFSDAPSAISSDGSIVTFATNDPNVVLGDTNGTSDVFARDLVAGTTTRVSITPGGGEFAGACGLAQISADGKRVLFAHVPPGTSTYEAHWYVRDRAAGTTRLVSIDPSGAGGFATYSIDLAAGGRHVLFSATDDSIGGRGNGLFVHDVDLGVTTPATRTSGWSYANPLLSTRDDHAPLAISASGRHVLVCTDADLDPSDDTDTDWRLNNYVYDRKLDSARLVTRYVFEPQYPWNGAWDNVEGFAYVSDDGLTVRSRAHTIGGGLLEPVVGYDDEDPFYEFDLATQHTRVLSLNWHMRPFIGYSLYLNRFGASDDGRTVAIQIAEFPEYDFPMRLWGRSTDQQIYVRRVNGSASETVCAGDGSGAPCPCGTPGIEGRGCANAFTSRGTELSTRGNASLSDDTLTFIAYETTSTTTVLLQSAGPGPAGGVPFGGGVLCVGSPMIAIALDDRRDDFGAVKLFGRGGVTGQRLSELVGITAPGARSYQTWSRASGGTSCAGQLGSLSNGLRVEWIP